MSELRADPTCRESIILVGGLGTRLRSVVSDVPKPMAPVGGRPFVFHLIDYWNQQGIERFVLASSYLHEVIQEGVTHSDMKPDIAISVEPSRMGTGGGLLWASKMLKYQRNPVLVMNGDSFIDLSLPRLEAFHREQGADLTICLLRVSASGRYSPVELGSDGKVVSFGTANRIEKGEVWINAGVYMMAPALLHGTKWKPGDSFSLEGEVVPELLASGKKVFGFKCVNSEFIDIGVPEDLARAQRMVRFSTRGRGV